MELAVKVVYKNESNQMSGKIRLWWRIPDSHPPKLEKSSKYEAALKKRFYYIVFVRGISNSVLSSFLYELRLLFNPSISTFCTHGS